MCASATLIFETDLTANSIHMSLSAYIANCMIEKYNSFDGYFHSINASDNYFIKVPVKCKDQSAK